MRANGSFNEDSDSVNKNIEQIIGKSVIDDDIIEELQDELDDLHESEKEFGNMLSTAR